MDRRVPSSVEIEMDEASSSGRESSPAGATHRPATYYQYCALRAMIKAVGSHLQAAILSLALVAKMLDLCVSALPGDMLQTGHHTTEIAEKLRELPAVIQEVEVQRQRFAEDEEDEEDARRKRSNLSSARKNLITLLDATEATGRQLDSVTEAQSLGDGSRLLLRDVSDQSAGADQGR